MIRKAKSSYDRRIIEESSDDPKNFWKAVKKVLPNKLITTQPSASIEPITVDGKTTTDALIIANGFCTYFETVVEELLSNVPTLIRNQLSAEACLNNSSQSLFSLKPVSAAFVNRQLRLLKSSKGTNSSPSIKGCDFKHFSSANSHNKSLDFFCSCIGGMEICKGSPPYIKMGIKLIWITTVPSPFYRWLQRSFKEPCKLSYSII